jgi:predicted CDP-diglyceride synthetase/phosphatidate cytidylyltransferase
MARRYFNVFKNHVYILLMIVVLICTAEFTEGAVSTISKVLTGMLMIYSAISYTIWLIKSPTHVKEENL